MTEEKRKDLVMHLREPVRKIKQSPDAEEAAIM